MWLKLKKKIDLKDPTPLIDQVYLGCTQRASITKASKFKAKE